MPVHAYTPAQYALVMVVIVVTLAVWVVMVFILIPRWDKREEQRQRMKNRRRIPGPAERMSKEDLDGIVKMLGSPPDDPPKKP